MARSNITELTEDQVLARSTDRFFRRVSATTPIIPGTYSGKYVILAAIAIDVAASEAQMDGFEASIEAITGVHKAHVLVGPARIPLDRVPADHDLRIAVEGGFRIDAEPEA